LIAEQISALSSDLRQLPDSMRGIISNGRRAYHDTDKSASRVNQKNAGHAHVNFNNAGGQQMTNISTRIINRPVVIRYNGLADDAGYNRLTSMLQYFQGDCPVKIFLPAQNRLIDLAPDFWIQPDNAVLQELAMRYGARNISLL
jgi:hypothetical protein